MNVNTGCVSLDPTAIPGKAEVEAELPASEGGRRAGLLKGSEGPARVEGGC